MPIEFRDIYSISHFINIIDKLCGRLTKTFPAALTSSGRGGSTRRCRQFIRPLSSLLEPKSALIACRMLPSASGQETFPAHNRSFLASFIYYAAHFEGEPQHIADHVLLVCVSPWKCPYMCRWVTQPRGAVSLVLGWCVLMCFRCDSWPDKRIPIIEYKVRGLLLSVAQIESSATQTVWRCQGWHGLSPQLCALLFTHLWQIVLVCVCERERVKAGRRAESKMSRTKYCSLVSIDILFCIRLKRALETGMPCHSVKWHLVTIWEQYEVWGRFQRKYSWVNHSELL